MDTLPPDIPTAARLNALQARLDAVDAERATPGLSFERWDELGREWIEVSEELDVLEGRGVPA